MTREEQIAAALLADFLFGDPRWLPHPVRAMGRFAIALEAPMRGLISSARLAGVVTVCLVVGVSGALSYALLETAGRAAPWLHDAASILLFYTCFAAHDLARHALDVYHALSSGVERARQSVARMVGRDTAALEEPGIVRATVESVAENTVDGVTAPLIFAFAGGPVLAMMYKAASTLDSTFGYRNERYLHFGWASARLDDVAAWIPARLTLPLICLGAALTGGSPARAWKSGLRDGPKHASPNAGLSEAAFAGALGVQLGGPLYRRGEMLDMPYLGDPVEPLHRRHILRAVVLMMVVCLLTAASGAVLFHFARKGALIP